SVHIPDNVTFIGNSAFGETTNLTSISLPSKLICIDGQAFKGCAIRSISLPNGLTQIGYQAFQGSELEQVVIPDSVKILGITNLATEGAFEDC
ncbi:leucine-rich repeat domain-containing protein, partial [Halanaerobium saccharolyticum]